MWRVIYTQADLSVKNGYYRWPCSTHETYNSSRPTVQTSRLRLLFFVVVSRLVNQSECSITQRHSSTQRSQPYVTVFRRRQLTIRREQQWSWNQPVTNLNRTNEGSFTNKQINKQTINTFKRQYMYRCMKNCPKKNEHEIFGQNHNEFLEQREKVLSNCINESCAERTEKIIKWKKKQLQKPTLLTD